MPVRQLISIRDLSAQDVTEIFDLAVDVKSSPEKYRNSLSRSTIGLLLDGPSTRTRTSFLAGVHQMGGVALQLDTGDLHLGSGESAADTGKTLAQYLDGIVARLETHADLVELSRACAIPVVNGRTDLLHPCQALADFFTLRERGGELAGKKVAYVGDGGSICHSLIYGAIKSGMHISVATPESRQPKGIIVKSANREASSAGLSVEIHSDPSEAVRGACAVVTAGWERGASEDVRKALAPFRVDGALMEQAEPDALFLHPLPAARGQEVAADVIDGAQSVVFEQAHNRLHVQKAILCALVAGG